MAFRYDARGNKIGEAYFGTDDQPILRADWGVARIINGYDDHDNLINVTFFGTDGQPVLHKEMGAAAWTYRYDQRGNRSEIRWLDAQQTIMMSIERAYDSLDELTSEITRVADGSVSGIAVPQLEARLQLALSTKNHAEAYQAGRAIVDETEHLERKYASAAGSVTASRLGQLAWYALFAGAPGDALFASERALSLVPDQSWLETNKAHALMLLDRADEARVIYLANRGRPLPNNDNKLWEVVIREDFAALREAGVTHPQMAEIEAALAKPPVQAEGKSSAH
jgi:YD repeat-containing protein